MKRRKKGNERKSMKAREEREGNEGRARERKGRT
jgi:hypothetical protein